VKSEDPFQSRQALKIADDEPHGKLPPESAGESYTLKKIIILKSRLNQHSENRPDDFRPVFKHVVDAFSL
jgi:hypothetical protein